MRDEKPMESERADQANAGETRQALEGRYVDGDYLAHNPTWHEEHGKYKAQWIDGLLKKNSVKPHTIAEIGCGAGEVAAELKRLRPAARISGFEISPQAHSICLPKTEEGLDFRLGDFFEETNAIYDLLLAVDVFEHVPDYIGFLSKMKPRGQHHVFHIPLDLSAQSLLRGTTFDILRDHTGHLHYFFKDTALATLRDCGFEIMDWKYTRISQEVPGKPLRTRLANMPRCLAAAISEDWSARILGGCSLLVLAR
jgi:cyclopropane fatty-acyl-phospholipid synthase-like methyltransferase